MKKCRNCGAELEDKANYCSDCGAAQYGDSIYREENDDRYERPMEQEVVRDDSARSNRMPIPMLLGVIGIVASFLVSGLAGIVLGVVSRSLDGEKRYQKFWIWAIVLGVVMTIVDIVLGIFYVRYFSQYMEELMSLSY